MTGAIQLVEALGGGGYFSATNAGAGDRGSKQGGYEDSAVKRLECFDPSVDARSRRVMLLCGGKN